MIPLMILGFIVLIGTISVIAWHNRFVRLRQHKAESWSDIDVELKRRYDLIPNLVQTVKGYAAHERELLEEVTALRNRAADSTGATDTQARDESALMLGLKRLFIVVEAYPDLKADAHFLALQKELALTEDRIAAARRFYNANVRSLRQLREMFPTSIIAKLFGFEGGDYFELSSDAERVVPRVDLSAS